MNTSYMFEICLIFTSIGLLIMIESYHKWKTISSTLFIDDNIVAKRKRYRNLSIWGLLFVLASGYVFVHHLTWNYGYLPQTISMLFTGIAFGHFRCFIEPYYNATITSDIKDLCLYLRPFKVDHQNILNNPNGYISGNLEIPTKIEKVLCSELNKRVAQTFAIGNPQSNIPTIRETSNIYANDSEWKNTIISLCQKASIILIRVGLSDGCLWEINHCMNNYLLKKTIFLIEDRQTLRMINDRISPNIDLDENSLPNKSAMLLYLDETKDRWNIRSIMSAKDIRNALKEYIDVHPCSNPHDINAEEAKFPQTNKIPALLWQILSFTTNAVSYCLFNKWPKKWLLIFAIYYLSAFVVCFTLRFFYNINIYTCMLVVSTLLSPWLYLGPKISWKCRNWGSEKLFSKSNRSLFLWQVAFFICVCAVMSIPIITLIF